jgi:hypothetical protein
MNKEAFLREVEAIHINSLSKEIYQSLNVTLPKSLERIFVVSRDIYNGEIQVKNNVYEEVRLREQRNNADYFYNLLHMGVQNGISAVFYNLNTFIGYSNFVREHGYKLISIVKPSLDIVLGIPTNKLIFEYEHFTLHIRSTLDRLNWFFNYYFLTDTGNLYRLHKHLSNNYLDHPLAKNLIQTIDNNRDFLDEFISTEKSVRRTERDILAHREGKVTVKLLIKDKHFDKEAEEVLKERYEKFEKFIIQAIEGFLKRR